MRPPSTQGGAVGGPIEASASPRFPDTYLCVGAKTAGQDGFGYFRRNESTSWCGGETPCHTPSAEPTRTLVTI